MRSFNSVFHSLITTGFATALLLAGTSVVLAASPQSARNLLPAAVPQVVHPNPQQHVPTAVRLALSLAPIHSRKTLESYLTGTKMTISPLRYLPPAARKRFLASLTFNEKGLTGFYYGDFDELLPSQAYQILQLFGAQYMAGSLGASSISSPTDALVLQAHNTGPEMRPAGLCQPTSQGDYPCYICTSHANCAQAGIGNICMHSC